MNADRAAVLAAVRTGLREGWHDDYSVDSVAETVTTHVLAALADPADPISDKDDQ